MTACRRRFDIGSTRKVEVQLMVRAPLPDFQVIFRRIPGLYLLLGTDSCIVEATDTWLRHTGFSRTEVLGRNLFEILADCPGERAAGGIRELRESLSRVLHLRRTDAVSIHCYGVRHRQDELHGRYWALLNEPVLDPDGQVAWVIHRVRDMTALVNPHSGRGRTRRDRSRAAAPYRPAACRERRTGAAGFLPR